ncbi:hypothetical protein AB0F46_17210 [Streptomyces sp. NPDC026665]|uniref:hypothetical protein n=1 Tax=Streptomyces sp. NPDC026665 TaxID=3154798 RepID=UPI0034078B6E
MAQLSRHVRPPGADTPPTREVPQFAPLRVRGGRFRPRLLARHRRRALAAGLAMTAAALVAAGPGDAGRARGHPAPTPSASAAASAPVRGPGAAEKVRAPVRIADGAAVSLLRPGDRVDVIAADGGGEVRVVAAGARVTGVPDTGTTGPTGTGALVVLSVPRATAVRLAGAGTTSRLAVTLR